MPLSAKDAERCECDELADEPPCRFPDHDVTVASLLLQARGDVHRVADDLFSLVRHHLAGVDGDAQPGRADRGALLVRERAKPVLHCDCRAHGADGVVLGDVRRAEDRLHAVAEELRDRAAVALDRGRASPRSSAP